MLSVIFLCVAIKEREKEKELTQRIYSPQIHKVSAENKRKATTTRHGPWPAVASACPTHLFLRLFS
jgi:hypothetical protein